MAHQNADWRSPALGEGKRLAEVDGLRYHDTGSGPPIVFVHGALVNANLWRDVVQALAGEFRCVALDLPFGAHIDARPREADLTPPACANLVADAIEALGLEEVTLVGNDTGGAICQLVVTSRPERIGRLVLTNCDAFDNFPPKLIKPMLPALRMPGALAAMLAPMRFEGLRRRGFGLFVKRPIDKEVLDSYVLPALGDSGVRRDLKKFLLGLDERYTLEAAEHFGEFRKPALVAWAREDKIFPPKYGERLADALPGARLEWVDDSFFLVPEDRPDRLAELVRELARERANA